MEKVKKFAPGQTVWIITRDELGIPFDVSGFMYLAQTGPALIVTPFLDRDGESLDYSNTVNELLQETLEGDPLGVYMFHVVDAFHTKEAAGAEMAYELSATPETEGKA